MDDKLILYQSNFYRLNQDFFLIWWAADEIWLQFKWIPAAGQIKKNLGFTKTAHTYTFWSFCIEFCKFGYIANKLKILGNEFQSSDGFAIKILEEFHKILQSLIKIIEGLKSCLICRCIRLSDGFTIKVCYQIS